MIGILWGIGGMAGILLIAFLLSSNRRAIRIRTVAAALGLQVVFGIAVLYWPFGQRVLEIVSSGVQEVIGSANAGIDFVFGGLVPEDGVVFALQVLPVIIFFASLTAVLYHWGILQFVVNWLGRGIGWLLGTRRAESVNTAANIFVGQTEAPLVIRPYIPGLTRSGLFAVMVGGLTTVAGSVLVGYSLLGAPLEYLIAASFMAAPGALLMAKILEPETVSDEEADRLEKVGAAKLAAENSDVPVVAATDDAAADAPWADGEQAEEAVVVEDPGDALKHRNVIDAAAAGASDGLRLALTVGAMLLAFIALIALVNLIIGTVGGWFGAPDLTFEQILGWVFAPIMTMIGVPWNEAVASGSFVGQKVVVNEFVAFADFGPQIESFSPKTAAITTFALTGFANLSSLGILLGGLGGLAPERRPEIAELGIRAILAATLANLMSATIVGMMLA
ncbi:NupC/NupG family nucleoside CNT transporter [Kocuria sp. p3-SID1428]|uniref:NupC/NupG family nucleoside CNT transporter n=2 Tax=unclassified Kocuria TaxID=2649579 RepID=UPI0021A65F75|nr:NupC/NupG family nucleoside CNT transporter [Kocuria sp. p3-SID1428]MCT1601058.1 NupC/NupG family nucleoside CNT transporter [Kocuria sp. p3-SID1428]